MRDICVNSEGREAQDRADRRRILCDKLAERGLYLIGSLADETFVVDPLRSAWDALSGGDDPDGSAPGTGDT